MPVKSLEMTQTQIRVNSFVRSVYNWMGLGLALTGFVAYYVSQSPAIIQLVFSSSIIFFGLILGELALVFYLSARIQKMSAIAATGTFLFYAGLNGVTLSFIFIYYTQASVASTFFICALTFIAVSIYGWTTKRDLTGFRGFLMMGLMGIIIASLVNFFMRSTVVHMMISYIGVIVFVGLTAYDTQKIKKMDLSQPDNTGASVLRKGAIMGALSLYLDFINLFLMLLRIFGDRR